MFYTINMKGNSKTAIPTTTSSKTTCPNTCPLKEKGCYAKYSFLGKHWENVTNGTAKNSMEFGELLQTIKALPDGQLWRHNQAGDLPHVDGKIVATKAYKLAQANKGKKGFTYTHHDVEGDWKHANSKIIKDLNEMGFTVNLSANDLDQADSYVDKGIAPVVSLIPMDSEKVSYTPKGRKVIACPAEKEKITCKQCKLCSDSKRDYVIGFRAHGTAKKHVNLIAKG